MPYINQSKLNPTKIYKIENLLVPVNNSGKDKRISIFLTVDNTAENFFKLSEFIRFSPNSSKKIYKPDFTINETNLKTHKSNDERNEFFNSLKEFSITYSKLNDLKKLDEVANNPIILDLSAFRKTYNNYLSLHKKKASLSYGVFDQMLKGIFSLIPEGYKVDTYIQLSDEPDSFIEGIVLYLKYRSQDTLTILDKLNPYFVSFDNTFVYHGDYKDIKEKARIINLLSKIEKLSLKGNTEDLTAEVEVITKDSVSAEDENLAKISDNSADQAVESPVATAAKDVDSESTVAPGKQDENQEANLPDLSEILLLSATNAENERIRQENADFIKKTAKQQSDAISKFESEAFELSKDKELTPQIVNDDNIINEDIKRVHNNAITTSYYNKQFKYDLINILKSLNNDPEHPLVITKFSFENNSTSLNKVDELTVELMDKRYKKHTFKVDVPKLSHDGFLLINGNKKFIAKQALPVPVIKETEDRVQITTNYRKTFLYRKGEKTSGYVDKILRLIAFKDFDSIKKTYGNSTASNNDFPVSIHYNYISKKFFTVNFNGDNGSTIYFNQLRIREELEEMGYKFDETVYLPIGFVLFKGKPVNVILEKISDKSIQYTDIKSDAKPIKKYDNLPLLLEDKIKNSNDPELLEVYNKIKPSMSLSYTEIKIVSTSMALGALIAAYKGLLPALDLYGVKYHMEAKRIAKKDSEMILAFKDMYLYIDTEFDTKKEIFVNGIMFLDSQSYNISETGIFAPIYLDYLNEATGSRNTAKALMNFESSMIDPITAETLVSLNLPTNFPELLLYGNSLLGSFEHDRKNDMSHFRLRDSEIITVAVYNSLMNGYNDYKRTVRSGLPQPLSVRKDAVIKAIQEMNNVENYSTLNPYLEAELKSKATFKGPSGLNSSDAYTAEIRSYDKSMLGLYGVYTPISAEVGVNRSLTVNPKLDSTRGFIKKFDIDKAHASNLFSMGELLNVFTPKHADSPRTIMSTTQSKHIVPTKVQHSYIIGNGSDKALGHTIGQDFCFKAVDDGVVESIDTKKELCVVRYKDKTTSVIDFSSKAAENIGSGFYIENKLSLLNKIKVGYKFKKGEILASDANFFKEMLDGSTGFAAGTMAKIAVMCQPETFEDSAIITDKLIEDMSSNIINEREVVLTKNSRIISMKKLGDSVEVNDPLVIFEEVGDDEKTALAALEKLDSSTKASIEELARSTAKAKFAGEIFDIQIFYNCPLEDMHPTLREVVETYVKKYQAKAKVISNARPDEFIQQPSTDPLDTDKIFGNDLPQGGVVIQYYISTKTKMIVGDKITFFIALKAIIAETIEEGKEPYSDYRPEEEVSALISPMSLVSRMVPDLYLLGYSNKVIMELERQVIDLLEE